mgnify:CR=1 FL=1
MDADNLTDHHERAAGLALEALGLEDLGHLAFQSRVGLGDKRRIDHPRLGHGQAGKFELALAIGRVGG